jgi:aspartyl-tRNA(Asn)/glutamyl-tRNA(Gln) amidotransferase subunit A
VAKATVAALRAALDAGQQSACDLADAAIARAKSKQDSLRAFIRLREEGARADAAAADARRAAGELRSPLDGIPVAIKDNIAMRDEVTTCASPILEGYVSPFSATVVEKSSRPRAAS